MITIRYHNTIQAKVVMFDRYTPEIIQQQQQQQQQQYMDDGVDVNFIFAAKNKQTQQSKPI